jgi:hypothetical protein
MLFVRKLQKILKLLKYVLETEGGRQLEIRVRNHGQKIRKAAYRLLQHELNENGGRWRKELSLLDNGHAKARVEIIVGVHRDDVIRECSKMLPEHISLARIFHHLITSNSEWMEEIQPLFDQVRRPDRRPGLHWDLAILMGPAKEGSGVKASALRRPHMDDWQDGEPQFSDADLLFLQALERYSK